MPRTPVMLAIEISNPSAQESGGTPPGAALGRLTGDGVRTLGVEPIAPGSRHDDDLMPAIDRLFAANNASPADLARIAVSAGPGGFTGLRVAITTAKLLAEATGAETVAVPTPLVAARSMPDRSGRVLVCLASKRGEAYAELVADGRPTGEARVIDASGIESFRAERLIADASLPGSMRARAEELGVAVEPLALDAAACLELGAGMDPVDPITLSPHYPREPEAVRRWRELHG